MRFFAPQQRPADERLLWSRDIRFANRLARAVGGARLLELDSGACLIAPREVLTDAVVADVAREARNPEYGIVAIDRSLPESDRYLVALSAAVQASGIADRIGMAQTTQIVQTKLLDLFFHLNSHHVAFQPIVSLRTGELHEYECLFRPEMPQVPQSITSIVQAAIDTNRSVELDAFTVPRILERSSAIAVELARTGGPPLRVAINLTPASLLDDRFAAPAIAAMVRAAGLSPRQITLECTEQQAVPDVVPLRRQVKALRRLGFGFAVDDAGAGYASFRLIAALRPSIIKIDREIVVGISRDDAKQALVEAFVSFGERIGARLLAEGIETRRDLTTLVSLGVELGQGYLLGRPKAEPAPPRPVRGVGPAAERRAPSRAAEPAPTRARSVGMRRAARARPGTAS